MLSRKNLCEKSRFLKNNTTFAVPTKYGVVAQLVEQRTENPCVTGSIPVDTTQRDLRTGFISGPFLFSGVSN